MALMSEAEPAGTARLAYEISRSAEVPLPAAIAAETTRSILNGVGVAVGAAAYPEIDSMMAAASTNGVRVRTARVPGRRERVDPLSSAVVTGAAVHIDDFDDTHLATVVHPAAAAISAAIPLLSAIDGPGHRVISAVALGMETQIRVADVMTPWHYDRGWHITGTVGSIGAAVTAAVLLGLDEERLGTAIAIASSMTIGHRQGFGTTAKAYHPGKAAANGLLAARLAESGATASTSALEGPFGFFACMSEHAEIDRLTDGFGTRWAVADNTYKPYPCGVVSHPAIEAAERLHGLLRGGDVAAVRIRCHPLLQELAGNPNPATGLAARFSAEHSVAVALIDGAAGLSQFTDDRVHASDVVALRAKVTLVPSDDVERSAAVVEVELPDGRTIVERVDAVRGSLSNPMTDAELDAKAAGLVERTMPGSGRRIVDTVRGLQDATSTENFLATVTPEDR